MLGNAPADPYNQPATASPGWWQGLPIQRMFVGVGGDEILLDAVKELTYKIKEELSRATLNVIARAFYQEPIIDLELGLALGEQSGARTAWLREAFIHGRDIQGSKI
ncbi:hypothetical protein BBP40_010159 [Aspergillus hancockii]|nr:hypothetical protein BBP40_010159 [Aspergillus hancockii]